MTLFEEIEDELIQWQECCPTKTDTVSRLRPKVAAPADSLEAVKSADLPHIFAETAPCGTEMHGWQGQGWFKGHAQERERAWQVLYGEARAELHTCCIRQFEFAGCLKDKQRTQPGALSGEDVASCQQQFAPAQLLNYPAAGGDNLSLTAAAGQQALARAIEQTIQMKWPEAEPTRPPDDYGGIALLACAAGALVWGFFLGLPGCTRRREMQISGAVSSGLALTVFLVASIAVGLLATGLRLSLVAACGLLAALLATALRTGVRLLLIRKGRAVPPWP